MKNSEILARAVAEAAGLPLESVRASLAAFIEELPPGHRMNQDRAQAEAEQLLADLRQEMAGIRCWLLEGYLDAVAAGYPPFPLRRPGLWNTNGHAGTAGDKTRKPKRHGSNRKRRQ
ncbi:hypothetical protein JCM30471_27370 [Desulfuromonas carbonis]